MKLLPAPTPRKTLTANLCENGTMGFHAAHSMAESTSSEPSVTFSVAEGSNQSGCERGESSGTHQSLLAQPAGSSSMPVCPSSPETGSSTPTIDGDRSNEKVDVAVLSAQRLDRLSIRDGVPGQPLARASSSDDSAAKRHAAQHLGQLAIPDRAPSQPLARAASLDDSDGRQFARPREPARIRRRSVSPCPSAASSHCSSASLAFSNPRQRFLLFIKILFKCLTQANEPEVLKKAQKIVSECTKRNRQGDPKFTPLMEAVEKRLRGFVGEVHWRRSLLLLRHYILKKHNAELQADEVASR